jgi:hypothetical protein
MNNIIMTRLIEFLVCSTFVQGDTEGIEFDEKTKFLANSQSSILF